MSRRDAFYFFFSLNSVRIISWNDFQVLVDESCRKFQDKAISLCYELFGRISSSFFILYSSILQFLIARIQRFSKRTDSSAIFCLGCILHLLILLSIFFKNKFWPRLPVSKRSQIWATYSHSVTRTMYNWKTFLLSLIFLTSREYNLL